MVAEPARCRYHPSCTCEKCYGEWCGDVGNIVYHQAPALAVESEDAD